MTQHAAPQHTTLTITDVLGTVLPVSHYYGDGSYDCPHCFNVVRADEGFDLTRHNPWCIANPAMPVESARKIIAEREHKAREERERERNHELAMQRIAEYQQTRYEVRTRLLEEAREQGYCVTCIVKTDGRTKVRHRGECPRGKR